MEEKHIQRARLGVFYRHRLIIKKQLPANQLLAILSTLPAPIDPVHDADRHTVAFGAADRGEENQGRKQ